MSTLAQLRTRIRDHVVFDVTKLDDATCDEFINTAIDVMQHAHDWQFQQESSVQFPYGVSTDGVLLPDDFVTEVAVFGVNESFSDPAMKYEEIKKFQGGRRAWVAMVQSDTVFLETAMYYIWASKFYIVPQPTGDALIQVDYIKGLSELSGDDSNGFVTRYPRAVLWGALHACYLWLHEVEKAAAAEALFTKLMGVAVKRDTSGRVGGGPQARR